LIFTDTPSVQPTCTIILTSLTTLTTDGGVIFDGTQNVIIYCLCMRDDVAVAGTRWFFPNRTQIRTENHRLTRPDNPYFRNNVPSALVICKFVYPYLAFVSMLTLNNSLITHINLPYIANCSRWKSFAVFMD